jgi:hypothetical protein
MLRGSVPAWQDVNRDSWSFTRRLIIGAGGGIGAYRTSYAINTGAGVQLNGRISADIRLPTDRPAGAGLVCRADAHWSFIAFHTAPGGDGSSTLARIAVLKQGTLTPIAVLDEPVQLTKSNRFSLEFFSQHLRGEIDTGEKVHELFADCPQLPFTGYPGLIKLYSTEVAVTNFETGATDRPPVVQTERRTGEFEFDVFLCHATPDKDVVIKIANTLHQRGLIYWLDAEQIEYGQPITERIEDGLQKSRYVVPCISKKLGSSNWARAEYGAILNAEFSGQTDRRVIPLALDDTGEGIPLLLRDRRRVSYRNKVEFEEFTRFLTSR